MGVAGEDLHTGFLMGVTHDRVTACSLHVAQYLSMFDICQYIDA